MDKNRLIQTSVYDKYPRIFRAFTWLFLIFLAESCVIQFIPETDESQELLVVEGMITDQYATNKVKLSKSFPLSEKSASKPLGGCDVSIADDLGNYHILRETVAGTYCTDSTVFRGVVGRTYTLRIIVSEGNNQLTYESDPMKMQPVSPIDSIYYEKKVITEKYLNYGGVDACQIYLDTHDPANSCKYFRWDYTETWVLRLLFPVENIKCWVTENSRDINIKSTIAFDKSIINRHPLAYISNNSDRLKREYSILVNQYSMNENEYNYWEKLENLNVQVGGLYDIIPVAVPSNITCIEKPEEKVLGFFSVSAKSSKRIFIVDDFAGIIDRYNDCITDTIYGDDNPPQLNVSLWVLSDDPVSFGRPRTRILTDKRGCADCTVRGTNVEPDFWKELKKK